MSAWSAALYITSIVRYPKKRHMHTLQYTLLIDTIQVHYQYTYSLNI